MNPLYKSVCDSVTIYTGITSVRQLKRSYRDRLIQAPLTKDYAIPESEALTIEAYCGLGD